jgi:outer membrane protein OmpA-like peptidoglycan-associated protein
MTLASSPQIVGDQKAKIKGMIRSRSGDLLKVYDKKTSTDVIVVVNDNTKIDRNKHKYEYFGANDIDVTVLVPGLSIVAEGIGNAKGQLVAKTIHFHPDEFAIEVAEEQQILANQSAAGKAQSTADLGVKEGGAALVSASNAQTSANQAQSSANQAQASADNADADAQQAGDVAVFDAEAVSLVNKRVSDLDDYKTVAEAGIFFPPDGAKLDGPAKADLDTLAAAVQGVDGYMIEIAGYASSTGSKQLNQKLSADRAAAVARYLREKGNIPMRRMMAPAGYGATHPDAPNTDAQGRAVNRRVDVKVLVNKGFSEGL